MANNLTNHYYPILGMIVFTRETGEQDKFYVEQHDFVKTPAGYQMGAGVPMRLKTIRNIAAVFAQNYNTMLRGHKKLLHRRIVYVDQQPGKFVISWLVEPGPRELFFGGSLKMTSGFYPMPQLLMTTDGTAMNVFAITDKVLTEKSKLYYAPLPNINSSGNVCLGTTQLPKTEEIPMDEVITGFEEGFFKSQFNGWSHDEVLTKGNAESIFGAILGKKVFPTKHLVYTKATLGKYLAGL